MDKLACMKAFVNVAEAEGFSSAARRSHQTKALLSKYVAQLEESLGVRLFQRTTRQVTLTETGRAYYARCKPLIEELDELEAVTQDIHTSPSGELKISAPTSFSELHLMGVVSAFTAEYPDVSINLMLSDHTVDIIEEGFDLALRIGILDDSSLIARKLCSITRVTYASPEYLEKNGMPEHPEDLLRYACILDTNLKDETQWIFEKDGIQDTVKVAGRLRINSAIAVKELALAHSGIALSPTFVCGEAIRDGQLKVVLPDYKIEALGLYAVYSHRRHLSTKVQLFMNALKENFTDNSAVSI